MHRHSAQSLPSGTWAGHLPCLSLRTNQSASGVPNSHTSRTAKISRTSQECAAGRTAIGVVEQPEPEDFPPEVLTTFLSGKPRRVSRNPQKRTIKQYISGELHRATEETVSFMKFALQLSQLYAMYGVLFEMPASLFCPGGTVPMPAQCISLVYFAFFAVPRLWMRGKLLPQTHNTGMLPLIAFIFLVVAGQPFTLMALKM